MRADQPRRAALRIPLDPGTHGNPAHLAVVGPDDAIFGRVVAARALDGVEKVPFRPLAILRMDAVDPVPMRFVCGVGRQPVNRKIFRRAGVLETVAQVDLDATDTGDALDAREVGLAHRQRLVGAVALARDRFEVLLQRRGVGRQARRARKSARAVRACRLRIVTLRHELAGT